MQTDPIKSPGPKVLGSFFRLNFTLEILLAGFGFFVLTLIYFWDLLLPEIVFSISDHVSFFIPQRQRWVEQILDGSFPLWNPNLMGGLPLFATLQTAILYPFSIFYLWFPFFQVFKLTLFAHYGLAGFGMYVLMRADGTSRMGALLAAFCLMFGGYLVSLHYYLSTLFPVAWIPFLLLFFFWGLKRQDFKGAVLSGTITAFMFFAGGLETCMQVLPWLALAGWFPQYIFRDETGLGSNFKIKYLLACLTIFLGLSAIQLFPTFELSQLSTRGSGFTFERATEWSLTFPDFKQLITADPYGYLLALENKLDKQIWLRSLYVGALPLILAWFFIRSGGKRVWFCSIVVIFSLLLAFGKHSFLYQVLFELISQMKAIRYPVKFILPVMIVLPMAAGWGWDIFRKQMQTQDAFGSKRAQGLLILSTLCMVLFAVLDLRPGIWMQGASDAMQNVIIENVFNYKRTALITGLIAFCLFIAYKAVKVRTVFLNLALFIYSIDIIFGGMVLFKVIPLDHFNNLSEEARFIQSDPEPGKIFISRDAETAPEGTLWKKTIRGVASSSQHLMRDVRSLPDIQQVNAWTVLFPFRTRELYLLMNEKPLEDRINLLAMLNVKHVLTPQQLNRPDLKPVFPAPGMEVPDPLPSEPPPLRIYENPHRPGEAYLVGACFHAKNDDEVRKAILEPRFHPQTLVILETSPPEFPCQTPAKPHPIHNGRVQILERGYDSVTIEAETPEKAFLFVGDSFYPGWQAFVDGRETNLYRANFAFRALVLEPGTHRVEMHYRPLSFRLGLWISGLTLIACLVILGQKTKQTLITQETNKETAAIVQPTPLGVFAKGLEGRETSWILYLFFIFITLMAASDSYFHMDSGNRFFLSAFFSFVILLLALIKNRWKESSSVYLTPLTLSWIFFFIWSAVGFFYSVRPEHGIFFVSNYLGGVALLLGLVILIQSQQRVIDLLRILMLCAGGHALISLISQGNFYLDSMLWKSIFINPNFLANYLLFPLGISVYFFAFGENRRDRVTGAIVFFICGITLGFTQSRAGVLSFAIECLLILSYFIYFKDYKKLKRSVLLMSVTLVFYFILLSGLHSIWQAAGVSMDPEKSVAFAGKVTLKEGNFVRLVFWEGAWNIFKEYWAFGAGPRSYPILFPYFSQSSLLPIHAHNSFINIATDSGIVGLLLLSAGIFLIYRNLFLLFQHQKDLRPLIFIFGTALSGYFIHSLVEFSWPNPAFIYCMVLWVGLVDALKRRYLERPAQNGSRNVKRFLGLCMVFTLIAFPSVASLYGYNKMMANLPSHNEFQDILNQADLARKFCSSCDRSYLYKALVYVEDYKRSQNPDSLKRAKRELDRAKQLARYNPEQGILLGTWWFVQENYPKARDEFLDVYRHSKYKKEARLELEKIDKILGTNSFD